MKLKGKVERDWSLITKKYRLRMDEISGELKGKRIKCGNFGYDHISKEKDEKNRAQPEARWSANIFLWGRSRG